MRLDRFLSNATSLSRSQAQWAIRRGWVKVDGSPVRDPAHHIGGDSRVEYQGALVTEQGPRYFMLNKPVGYICATQDEIHPSVLDLLDIPNKDGLHPAGRLDVDTTGLVLITDDGDWSHRITSPRHKCPKTYRATLAQPLSDQAAQALRDGVQLRGEKKPTQSAELEPVAPTEVRLTISEGKYHQVKRMFAAVGNQVVALHRERIGGIALDPDLAPGHWRALTEGEIAAVGRGQDKKK